MLKQNRLYNHLVVNVLRFLLKQNKKILHILNNIANTCISVDYNFCLSKINLEKSICLSKKNHKYLIISVLHFCLSKLLKQNSLKYFCSSKIRFVTYCFSDVSGFCLSKTPIPERSRTFLLARSLPS